MKVVPMFGRDRSGLPPNHVRGSRDGILHHKKMASRINYNTPLKSVRTIRALKIEPYDPQKESVDDPARPSDADLMHDAGVAFVWENAPGRSKAEQERTESAFPVELKPPPHALNPPPNSKAPNSNFVEVPKSPPPVPAGTESAGRSFHHLFDNSQLPPADTPTAPPVRSQPVNPNHPLPPKPTQSRSQSLSVPLQSGHKPPQPRRSASAAASLSGQHSGAILSRNGGHDQPSARRTGRTRSQDGPMPKEGHPHSSLTDPNGGSAIVSTPEESKNEAVLHGTLSRGTQDYLSARLRQSQSPALGVKDFYLSGRHTLPSGVSSSGHGTRPNSCLPTRPNSASASEAGSQSDDGDQTDAGDALSLMNARDPDGRCQVSLLDGEQHESSSNRHTDPRARDFIMERFLPAAKAMVTETTPDSSERRLSSQETPLVSPTRKNGRSPLIGRSRFAFKDRFAEEGEGEGDVEEPEDVDQSDVLFKCKFPWQMGALRSAMPQYQITHHTDSESAEQSPSPSSAKNNKFSPSPTASFENRKDSSSPKPFSDGQHDDAASTYAESEGSTTPRGDSVCSFEERGLPPKSRNKNGTTIRRSNRSPGGVIGDSTNGESQSDHSGGRSNESSCRGSPAGVVPKDRVKEIESIQGVCDMRSGPLGSNGRRSPEMAYLGSLGSLLRSAQHHRRDMGRNAEAAVQSTLGLGQQEQPIPPSSILNHHRNAPGRAAPAAKSSSAYGFKHSSTTKPTYPGNGVVPDETHSYPKHQLKVNLIRQQAEPSGGSERSFESLTDEVWESTRESPAAVDAYDRAGKVSFTGNHNPNLPQSANESFPNASRWPLVKVTPLLYARTPSSDSKDASFSSVSERSLRSPTDLALTTPQPSLAEKYSPVSVLQPPLPKSPNDSWLFKVRPPVPPSTGTNWQGPKPKKSLGYNSAHDSMDVKWEILVKSENAQLRSKMTQDQKMGKVTVDSL